MFIVKHLRRGYEKKIDATGLAIFRIAYAIIFLAEILQMFYFRHLIFDEIPYIKEGAIDPTLPMLMWVLSVVFIIFGAYTRLATVINYIFSLVFIGTITSFEYHMFYAYMGVNFLLIFLPVSRCCSLDRLRLKLKYSNTIYQYTPPRTVSVWAYYLPVLLAVGFVYFDSIFFKFDSPLWLKGMGMWLPGSMPMLTHINASLLMNQVWLVKGLGYLTLIFETVFVFLFWFKNFRIPLLIIGIGLHIGILLMFPIPFFALGVSAIYMLLVPVKWWKNLGVKIRTSAPVLKVYYDMHCPLCLRTKIIVEHLDNRKRIQFLPVQKYKAEERAFATIDENDLLTDIHSVNRGGKVFKGINTYISIFKTIWYLKPIGYILQLPGIYSLGKKVYGYVAENRTRERCTEESCGTSLTSLPVTDDHYKILNNLSLRQFKFNVLVFGLVILILLQINVSYNSSPIFKLRTLSGFDKTWVGKKISTSSSLLKWTSGRFLGLTNHALFMDNHFKNYNHNIAIVYVGKDSSKTFLPIIDEKGKPGWYIYGPNWAKWTFRTNSPNIIQKAFEDGISDFTAFWAYRNNVDLDNAQFEIHVKKIESPDDWEYDFLNRQIEKPWIKAGDVYWRNNEFQLDLPNDIESL